MPMVLVNGKVDADVKRQADAILASEGKTASEVIRSLFQSIASTCQLPDFMRDDAQEQERQRTKRLNLMLSVAGIVQSSTPLSDADADRLLWEETVRRHA